MSVSKKMAFVFGDTTFTFTPDDIEAILTEWERENPGKKAHQMPNDEFSNRCLNRLRASARPTRTVLHN